MAHLARCGERARVVPIAPDAPAPTKYPVYPPSEANREPARTVRERPLVGRFDQQMHMIGLHRKMDEAKSIARAERERAAKLEKQSLFAQARERPHRAQGDMNWVAFAVLGPGSVRNAGARA